jgi:tetratricopeptide (TPR) repeat protein
MRSLFLLVIAVTSCVSVFSQTAIADRINAAGALIEQGHYPQAIASLASIEQSNSLSDIEHGRAETLLGLAHKDMGHMQEAEHFYENALGLLRRNGREGVDFAHALSCMGSLEVETADSKTGERTLHQAVQIENQLHDHAGLATAYLHLVGAAIGRKHWKEAQRNLDAARTETLLAGPNTGALSLDVAGTTGWLASITGRTADAASAYNDALDRCKTLYGAQHPLTGWTYLLAGRSSAANGDIEEGLANMREGLAILRETIGARTARFLSGELAYAKVLDQAGMRPEAEQLHAEASRSLAGLHRSECMNCTVSVWSLQNR